MGHPSCKQQLSSRARHFSHACSLIIIQIANIYWLLICASFKHFVCTCSFNPQNNPKVRYCYYLLFRRQQHREVKNLVQDYKTWKNQGQDSDSDSLASEPRLLQHSKAHETTEHLRACTSIAVCYLFISNWGASILWKPMLNWLNYLGGKI